MLAFGSPFAVDAALPSIGAGDAVGAEVAPLSGEAAFREEFVAVRAAAADVAVAEVAGRSAVRSCDQSTAAPRTTRLPEPGRAAGSAVVRPSLALGIAACAGGPSSGIASLGNAGGRSTRVVTGSSARGGVGSGGREYTCVASTGVSVPGTV